MTEGIAFAEGNHIIWQNVSEDLGVSEAALLVEKYSDVITITQEGRHININYETIDEVVKLLKQLKKDRR
jgi:hypothetical protein